MKTLLRLVTMLCVLAPAAATMAETFYNAKGRMAGHMRRSADGRTVQFYDAHGHLTGSAQRSRDGSSTQYFDSKGRMSGAAHQ